MKDNPVRNQVSLYDSNNDCIWVTDFYLADPYYVFRVTPHPMYGYTADHADMVMRELEPFERFMQFGSDKEYQTWIMPQFFIERINRSELGPLIVAAKLESGDPYAHKF